VGSYVQCFVCTVQTSVKVIYIQYLNHCSFTQWLTKSSPSPNLHELKWVLCRTRQNPKNTNQKKVGSKAYLCGELRLVFFLYSADFSKGHLYTVFGSLLFHSMTYKVFSIPQSPWTKVGALSNKTEPKKHKSKKVGSKSYLCGELRLGFCLYSANFSKGHLYMVFGSLVFHSMTYKFFSITQSPWTTVGALSNKTEPKKHKSKKVGSKA